MLKGVRDIEVSRWSIVETQFLSFVLCNNPSYRCASVSYRSHLDSCAALPTQALSMNCDIWEDGACRPCLAVHIGLSLRVHQQSDNQSVQTQHFGENENENHADKETGLLSGTTHASITDNSNGKAGGETGQTDGKTSTELDEAGEKSFFLREVVRDQDGNDQAVDTNDTSHDNGHDVWKEVSSHVNLGGTKIIEHTLDDKVRSKDTHGGDTNTRLGGSIGGTKAGEDDGGCAAHGTEEGLDGRCVSLLF